jgi:hypothetical protein
VEVKIDLCSSVVDPYPDRIYVDSMALLDPYPD